MTVKNKIFHCVYQNYAQIHLIKQIYCYDALSIELIFYTGNKSPIFIFATFALVEFKTWQIPMSQIISL